MLAGGIRFATNHNGTTKNSYKLTMAPSTKKCHHCGYYNKDLECEKEWTCTQCGKHHDRDINASKNILNEGIKILQQKIIENLWNLGG